VSDEQNGHGLSRLDRIERLMQLLIDDHLKLSDDHKMLLTAQVLQGERIDKLTESLKALEEAQKDTRQRLDVLTLTVDDLIRGRSA
jgi:hypothetical protein